jgi:hypothetical protein
VLLSGAVVPGARLQPGTDVVSTDGRLKGQLHSVRRGACADCIQMLPGVRLQRVAAADTPAVADRGHQPAAGMAVVTLAESGCQRHCSLGSLRPRSRRPPMAAVQAALAEQEATRVSHAFPSCKRFTLAESYLGHACSCHESEDGNARTGGAASPRPGVCGRGEGGGGGQPCSSR